MSKIKSKKFLGQHFLKSRNIITDIIQAADIKPSDVVLEVGPGKGVLTEALIEKIGKAAKGEPRQGRVIAVEKDKQLVDFLEEKFKGAKNLEIIHGDILEIQNSKFKIQNDNLKFKIVANIPYYITSRFLRNFLESEHQPSLMVLMVQKEVADRITAKDGKESILSISVKAYGQPKIIKKVPAKYFSPQPKVDSAILKIDKISLFDHAQDEKRFFELVKKGFSQKRKMLINNLKCNKNVFNKCKVGLKIRAENLSLENWKCLYENIK